MKMYFLKALKLLIQLFSMVIIIFLFGCTQVLPDLPEKEAGTPSITINTILDDDSQPLVYNDLFEKGTSVLFFAEAADVRNETIIYSWYINDELLEDKTTEFCNYCWSSIGSVSIKAVAPSGSESTEETVNISVFD